MKLEYLKVAYEGNAQSTHIGKSSAELLQKIHKGVAL